MRRLYFSLGKNKFWEYVLLALFLLALIFFIPVMATYIRTGLVPNFPTLIVCGFAVMAAIQSFFAGLILKTISRKNRQDFEIELYHVMREEREDETL